MLSLLKKSGDKAALSQPAWRPNFRNVEHLPDTKAVRTAFFINGLAVLLAVILLIFAVFKEYRLGVLSDNVAEWEQIIADNKAASDAAIKKFQEFQAKDKQLAMAEGLISQPLVFSDLVFHLGKTLPPDITLGAIDYRGTLVGLTGSVRGSPEQASGMVTAYLDQLRKDEVLKKTFAEVELVNMSRNAAAESISMELVLKFPAPAKKK